MIRPVIQGTGDIRLDKSSTNNATLSRTELEAAMGFVLQIFSTAEPGSKNPTTLDEEAKKN